MPLTISFGSKARMQVPFNRPYATGKELEYIAEAVAQAHTSGDGPFTKRIHKWLVERTGASAALLTHSCTAALEMMALLLDIGPGDEVIMPSYTFVSTANAFVLRGATPVFVDIREDTLNLDERLVEAAITPRTKAIVAVHYAGVPCEMSVLQEIAARYGIALVEDAAQAVGSRYGGRELGSIGALGALSFHETKNLISGEGGALLVNDPTYIERAEIIREKGTDRSKFIRGQVDKYTWVDAGSSYLPSDIVAAFLWAQLEHAGALISDRLSTWNAYHKRLETLEAAGLIRRPIIPRGVEHNGHIYYVLFADNEARDRALQELRTRGINALFHYIPLHSSPAGRRYGRLSGAMTFTDSLSGRLARLPIFPQMGEAMIETVCEALAEVARPAVPL